MPIRNIPVGSTVYCVELKPGRGAQLARSAGASAQIVARDSKYATIRLKSGERRRVLSDCRAVLGEVGIMSIVCALLAKRVLNVGVVSAQPYVVL